MDKPIVDIGVACNFAQSYQWWVSVMNLVLNESRWGDVTINAIRTVGSALPDHNKNNVIGNFVKRNALTDTNRTEVVKGFLDGRADYIFWLDDDTAPPPDAITRLLSRTNLESLLSKPVALLLNLSLDFVVINAFGLLDGLF